MYILQTIKNKKIYIYMLTSYLFIAVCIFLFYSNFFLFFQFSSICELFLFLVHYLGYIFNTCSYIIWHAPCKGFRQQMFISLLYNQKRKKTFGLCLYICNSVVPICICIFDYFLYKNKSYLQDK